ncbi:M48 family metallopeptidase [Dactylosporangium aurantiacum]|uniref:M48 family metallopeptidase n=1 Tax=Dactylosporangium aurantiacum TaxID=35754 RepID=A0A9Q9IPU7_9ACTN|nr:M48 family metallopeptidase [Dactylosporangium aurantiacum]MDG6104144.1 M48 family metallopeptidase [Dactylosporangium aurantiacum]UWZ56848.1 M48 family metallopeptidase [Dactylosporangium aurantiacum]
MAVAARAVLSIIMLAGFYVLAVVQFVAGIVLAAWVTTVTTGAVGGKVGAAVFVGTVWAVGHGTWKALRARRDGPHGVPLTPQDAPLLWQTVHELSAAVGTRPPDEVHLVADVNAAVSERTRLMGLIGGRRHLYVGMPLLQTFTVAQLRSVLAHELGHYSGRHTRFAGVSYRGRLVLERTVAQIGPGNPTGWVFRGYALLFMLVQHAVSRRQELAADLASVRVAGRHAAAGALREVEVLDAAFGFYLTRFVQPGLQAGYLPEDLFGGFAEMLRARAEELSTLRAAAGRAAGEASRWDTHPPLAARVAAIMAAPETTAPVDHAPAHTLVADLGAAGRALQSQALAPDGAVVLPWDEFHTAGAVAALQERSDTTLRVFARAAGRPVADAGDVLDLVAAGRLDDLAAALLPGAAGPEARTRFAEALSELLTLAAVRSGAARWRHSWTSPPQLVGTGGDPLDLSGVAALACDPATLPAARQRLHERGIDVTAAKHVRRRVGPEHAGILAGVTTAIVDGTRADLLILTHGLLFVPGMPRYKTGMARYRMRRWLREGDPAQLAATQGSRFVPYEEIALAVRTTKLRFRWQLTLHDGTVLEVRSGAQSEQHADAYTVFAEAMHAATT